MWPIVLYTYTDPPDAMCERGSVSACVQLGDEYAACRAGSSEACLRLRLHGQDVDDPDREVLRVACDAGHGPSCEALGSLEADPALAAAWFRRACLSSVTPTCHRHGLRQLPRDRAAGIAFLEQACAGVPVACADLGDALADTDPAKAAAARERACEAKVPAGCGGLALQLLEGRGVAADPVRAIDLLEDACLAEVPNACAALADHLDRAGHPEQAAPWRRWACEHGDPAACR